MSKHAHRVHGGEVAPAALHSNFQKQRSLHADLVRLNLRGVRGLVRELDLKHGLELPARVEPLVRADV